jgi:hypothetical protein
MAAKNAHQPRMPRAFAQRNNHGMNLPGKEYAEDRIGQQRPAGYPPTPRMLIRQ